MTKYNRGIAGERAAVREAQVEAARQLEEDACRRRPSLGSSDSSSSSSSSSTDEGRSWLPGKFIVKKPTRVPCARPAVRERPDVLPLKTDSCLDMAPIKRGSFFFMSSRYVEEVEDWCKFDEEQRGATF
ncbi:hypothetical protein F4805DRAFT_456541 [Annulohypoxylon moriforme]|nr:hypothetical protein F4805DRAFT_456541 [Annulohypoxylon moriforme]